MKKLAIFTYLDDLKRAGAGQLPPKTVVLLQARFGISKPLAEQYINEWKQQCND